MNYSAINIQGNIISSEILEKVRTEDIRYQRSGDFGMNPSASFRDEINLAWSVSVSNWNAFKLKRESLNETDTGTAETRRYWILPLLQVLGYEVTTSTAEVINGKSYAISHRASNKDGFPIHIIGVNQSLDKRAESGGTRLSPHALVQEYLNNNEHMYALVSNGRFLRILRDATRLSRLSYLEFDLEQIMEEGLYVEFALLYRMLHASRMPEKIDSGADCILEFYHQEALASGSRIRERLSLAVENSIKELANGLLKNPSNQELRDKVLSQQIHAKEYYLYILRLVYRVLFLLVIEERKLIYPDKRDEDLNRKRSIYYNFYSIQRLTKLAEKLVYIDPRKTDLWQSLITNFSLFEYEQYGKKLGISPLGAGIFAPDALGMLSTLLLDNETFLKVLRYLVTFENENGQRVRVNYADLDVEEFGSVYEGLLDYDPEIKENAGQPFFGFVKGNDRSSSGSHYTPEELVRPLIKHSLDYLIEDKLKETDPEKGLLSLKICDVACGSGHILLSAARRVGFELAKARSKEDQPTPSVLRIAIRDVIRNCIYGVDFNPLAVELCKVALWLEAHEPGEPLNFLDHHIKCGNAIVGLAHRSELENGIADEAFKTLPGDDKDIAKIWRKKNVKERKERAAKALQLKAEFEKSTESSVQEAMAEYKVFSQLTETTPEEIERKSNAYKRFIAGKGFTFLKAMADTQVAQFFIPKTTANKDQLMTDGEYRLILSGYKGWQDRKVAKATAVAFEQRIFHWFIEFPEVFSAGGFDCVLGNPPFIAGRDIKQKFGELQQSFIFWYYSPCEGRSDLVAYFFRRISQIVNSGFLSLIATNTISQGETRTTGLEVIINNGFQLNSGYKSISWPGKAGVTVSLVTLNNYKNQKCYINGKEVLLISSRLEASDDFNESQPFTLNENKDLAFQGSIIYGEGFKISSVTAERIVESDSKYVDVIKPFLTGDDLNEDYEQRPSELVINFLDWPIQRAQEYPLCFQIVEDLVKPDRNNKGDKKAKEFWWIYLRNRIESYREIQKYDYVLVNAVVSKYPCFIKKEPTIVFSNKNTVFKISDWKEAVLHSSIYDSWIFKYSTTLGASTINFSIDECFNNFPFPLKPTSTQNLYDLSFTYHENRRQLMIGMQLGLTKTYNLFHSNAIMAKSVNEKDKQVAALRKHLANTPNTISFEEAIKDILKLRVLHVQMDLAVLDAYGWNDIQLLHDFYEVDYLPENDRIRYTIHPDARKEVLKRLLELNHKIHEEEVAAGLWDKNVKKKKNKLDINSSVSDNKDDTNLGGLFNQN